MNKLSSKPALIVGVVVVVVLAFIGGVLVARDKSSDTSSAAPSADAGASGSTSSTSSATAGNTGTGTTGGGDTGLGAGSGPSGAPVDPGQLVAVESAGGSGYTYEEADNGKTATGTVPPQTLPVKVSMTSTSNLHDGDPVTVRVEAIDGSQVFGFDIRLCRQDSAFHLLYDFFPQVTPQCALDPLSPRSDAFVRVASDADAKVAQGTFRVGTGSLDMTSVDGNPGNVTCDHDHPCKIVLLIQVPYGFGFQEFPVTYA